MNILFVFKNLYTAHIYFVFYVIFIVRFTRYTSRLICFFKCPVFMVILV